MLIKYFIVILFCLACAACGVEIDNCGNTYIKKYIFGLNEIINNSSYRNLKDKLNVDDSIGEMDKIFLMREECSFSALDTGLEEKYFIGSSLNQIKISLEDVRKYKKSEIETRANFIDLKVKVRILAEYYTTKEQEF